ncbi:MAG: ABC transporter substrate-binding protein [Candidatus Brocadiia bacterium]|nr:MAG: ABC transporter substrate-binding protein [Candidatus Brocadiia bacterium]
MKTIGKYRNYLRFEMDLLINGSRKIRYYFRGAFMRISVKQNFKIWITGIWCTGLVLLVLGHGVNADEKCAKTANDPNELWWSRWDAVVKDSNDPNELLGAKWNAVITVLQNKEPDQTIKKKIIDKIMSPIFDFELMAKLSLGKTHWPKLTEPQRKRFTELFTGRLRNFYLEKTTLYKNEKVLFKPAIQKKNAIHIPVVLVSSDKEVAILYKLHKSGKCWKIYDVEVQGVSILLTYRSLVDDILRRGTIEDLLSELEKPPAQ